jgi:hypothetical protein
LLVARRDFLPPRRKAGARVARDASALRIARLQPLEVASGIAQPVWMVDAQPVDELRGGQVQDQAVRRLEHLLVLDPQRRQVVHVEEAPVVDFVGATLQ